MIAAHKEDDSLKNKDLKMQRDYIQNPLYKRLKYVQVLMGFFYLAMFVYFPIAGNTLKYGMPFCSSDFNARVQTKCNYVNENGYIHLFFIVTTMYFILCALQIRYGESFLKNQKKKNRKWTTAEKLTNTIVTKVPFVFEIKTALDFAVTSSSLGLFEWFKFEDIYNTFFAAKYAQISSDMKRLGTVRQKFEKIIFGWVALFVFLAIVLAPIFIFSNFNPDSVSNEIKSIESIIGIKINFSQFVLFTNNNPKSIQVISNEGFYNDRVGKYTKQLNFKSNPIQMVQLYPFGDNQWSLSLDMYTQLDNLLVSTLSSSEQEAYLYMQIKTTQLNGKNTLYVNQSRILPQQVLVMHEMLTKCSSNKILVPNFYYQVGFATYPATEDQPCHRHRAVRC